MKKVLVLSQQSRLNFNIDEVKVITAKEYLLNPIWAQDKDCRVFNLCHKYQYQSNGYYVSLLAEARGHKPIPDVKSILDLRAASVIRIVSDDLDELIQRSLKKIKSKEFVLSIYFGQNLAKSYTELSNAFQKYFPLPYLRVKFIFTDKWITHSVKAISESEIPEDHIPFVEQFAQEYFGKKRYDKARKNKAQYSLAIVTKDADEAPPSNPKAIQKFIDIAWKMGVDAQVIKPKDINRLPAFDAVFIRTVTHIKNEAYQIARRAEAEGIPVIDEPDTILKCSNKVYLTELLEGAGVPGPKTLIVQKENRKQVEELIGFPCVLKLPDSTFSFGVKKANNKQELEAILDQMFKTSDLLIAQEYCFTDFDWRIGVLDGEPLYACKYYMARGHWQIYNWQANTDDQSGNFDTIAIEEIPPKILKASLKAARLVGKGLFGVDVKEINGEAIVIEVNDNPNIDAGIEDQLIGDKLYERIIQAFINRIETVKTPSKIK